MAAGLRLSGWGDFALWQMRSLIVYASAGLRLGEWGQWLAIGGGGRWLRLSE